MKELVDAMESDNYNPSLIQYTNYEADREYRPKQSKHGHKPHIPTAFIHAKCAKQATILYIRDQEQNKVVIDTGNCIGSRKDG